MGNLQNSAHPLFLASRLWEICEIRPTTPYFLGVGSGKFAKFAPPYFLRVGSGKFAKFAPSYFWGAGNHARREYFDNHWIVNIVNMTRLTAIVLDILFTGTKITISDCVLYSDLLFNTD